MSLSDFDRAFTSKVKAWFSNTIYAPTDTLYNVAFHLADGDSLKEALSFPLIGIYRPSGFNLNETQTFAARRSGVEYYYDDVNNKGGFARFLSVNLPYQLDIYAKTPESLNSITEQVMFALNLDQKLSVTQTDSENEKDYVESYDITYASGPMEQSEFSDDDRVFHYSIAYDIKNARILNFKDILDVTSVINDIDIEEET
jgi:hypothetical protein